MLQTTNEVFYLTGANLTSRKLYRYAASECWLRGEEPGSGGVKIAFEEFK